MKTAFLALLFYCTTAAAVYVKDGSVTTAKLGVTGGSTSAVGYPFVGDPNTGIYSSGANTLGLVTDGVERERISSGGVFSSPNPGQSTMLTECRTRAWVRIDPTTDVNLACTYSRTGTTVTVTATGHNELAGHEIRFNASTGSAADGDYVVTSVTNANVFTFTHVTSGSTSGNCTLDRSSVTASYNVANVAHRATGKYSINFSNFFPDTSYYADDGGQDLSVGTPNNGQASHQETAVGYAHAEYKNFDGANTSYLDPEGMRVSYCR